MMIKISATVFLFWGPDILSQCELALEVARILNCSENTDKDCNCLNCKWIREQTHPAVKFIQDLILKKVQMMKSQQKGKKI